MVCEIKKEVETDTEYEKQKQSSLQKLENLEPITFKSNDDEEMFTIK